MNIAKLEDLKPGMIVTVKSLAGGYTVCHDPERNRLFAWSTKGPREDAQGYASWCRSAELNYFDEVSFPIMAPSFLEEGPVVEPPTVSPPKTRDDRIFFNAQKDLPLAAQRQLWIAVLEAGGPRRLLSAIASVGRLIDQLPGGLAIASMLPSFNNGYEAATLEASGLNAHDWTIEAGRNLCEAGFALGQAERAEPEEETVTTDSEASEDSAAAE